MLLCAESPPLARLPGPRGESQRRALRRAVAPCRARVRPAGAPRAAHAGGPGEGSHARGGVLEPAEEMLDGARKPEDGAVDDFDHYLPAVVWRKWPASGLRKSLHDWLFSLTITRWEQSTTTHLESSKTWASPRRRPLSLPRGLHNLAVSKATPVMLFSTTYGAYFILGSFNLIMGLGGFFVTETKGVSFRLAPPNNPCSGPNSRERAELTQAVTDLAGAHGRVVWRRRLFPGRGHRGCGEDGKGSGWGCGRRGGWQGIQGLTFCGGFGFSDGPGNGSMSK